MHAHLVERAPLSSPSTTRPTASVLRLDALNLGERARITGYSDPDSDYCYQLTRLGLIPGVEFRLVRRAPLGDPIAIQVRGFSLALRLAEAQTLELERV